MDAIRQWAESICFAAIAGGITLLLTPSTGLSKVMKMAVTVFFLSALLLPLTSLTIEEALEEMGGLEMQSEELSNEIIEQSQKAAWEAATTQLQETSKKILEGAGIKPEAIAINITTDEMGNVQAEAQVQLETMAEAEKAEMLLSEAGLIPKITSRESIEKDVQDG